MPTRPPRACAEPGCPELAREGSRCPRHQVEAAARQRVRAAQYNRTRGSAAEQGYGAAWRKLRAQVLTEQPWCVVCGGPATQVDHIVPLKQGGRSELANVVPLCKPCHSRKTALRDGGFGRRG